MGITKPVPYNRSRTLAQVRWWVIKRDRVEQFIQKKGFDQVSLDAVGGEGSCNVRVRCDDNNRHWALVATDVFDDGPAIDCRKNEVEDKQRGLSVRKRCQCRSAICHSMNRIAGTAEDPHHQFDNGGLVLNE